MSIKAYVELEGVDNSSNYFTACYSSMAYPGDMDVKGVRTLPCRWDEDYYLFLKDTVYGKYYPDWTEASKTGVFVDASYSAQFIVNILAPLRYWDEYNKRIKFMMKLKEKFPEASNNSIFFVAHVSDGELRKDVLDHHEAILLDGSYSMYWNFLNIEKVHPDKPYKEYHSYYGRSSVLQSNKSKNLFKDLFEGETRYDPFQDPSISPESTTSMSTVKDVLTKLDTITPDEDGKKLAEKYDAV